LEKIPIPCLSAVESSTHADVECVGMRSTTCMGSAPTHRPPRVVTVQMFVTLGILGTPEWPRPTIFATKAFHSCDLCKRTEGRRAASHCTLANTTAALT